MLDEPLLRIRLELDLRLRASSLDLEEVLDEEGDVVPAFPERRQDDLDPANAEEDVAAEPALRGSPLEVHLRARDEGARCASSLFIIFGEADPETFIRGDSNSDHTVQLSDAVYMLGQLFLGTTAPACLDAADGNDDGRVDVTDAIFVLSHLYLGGLAPPPPFPQRGRDLTADGLGCGR